MKLSLTLFCLLAGTRAVLGALTPAEADSLQFMREEEKLAHDVYVVLYDAYGDAQFGNISLSEQRHTNSVLSLMTLYGVEDTAIDEPGVFLNPVLQAMYDDLIAYGLVSRVAAFEVGVMIEETDIADLDEALSYTTNPDLIRVFSNLQAGSYNHLDAFTRGLDALTSTSKGGKSKGRR
jgi:hypothetical protein